jgi:hypothetical protein
MALGGPELMVLIGIPLLYIVPIWVSIRVYREGQSHWRLISIVAVLLMSWVGFILVRAVKSGIGGYAEGRIRGSNSR